MSRNACENRRNGNDFHSGHRKQNSDLLIYFNTKDTFNKLGYKAKINTHTTSYIN